MKKEKKEEKLLVPLIFVFVMMAIAGIVTYTIGITIEHEYAWTGFIYWCIFLFIMVFFGIVPMIYYWRHPEKLEQKH